ncbi:MAG: hypothetical protein IIZ99_00125 [Turicibacter sp.]|nr:hypothetical protein [Turicibacter sp.]
MTSQAERVYNHLLIFGSITNAQAHENYGIRHLPSVIRDIKLKFNVDFDKERLTGCNRFGDKVWWEKYILKQKKENKFWELDK